MATGAALAMASVLFWAGLDKAHRLASVASIMARLGVPASSARTAAALLVVAELAVALGLVFRPGSAATLAGVLGLACVFGLAGLIAFLRNERIRCGCFSPYGNGTLGLGQVAALPFWLGGVALLWLENPGQSPDALRSASWLALVGLTMAALRAVQALKLSREARGDRRSALEMLLWLPR
jgi:hypothetical protein